MNLNLSLIGNRQSLIPTEPSHRPFDAPEMPSEALGGIDAPRGWTLPRSGGGTGSAGRGGTVTEERVKEHSVGAPNRAMGCRCRVTSHYHHSPERRLLRGQYGATPG